MQRFRASCVGAVVAIAALATASCEGVSSNAPASPTVSPPVVAEPQTSPTESPSSAEEGTLSEAEIWSQLRQGKGYVILFRHALAPGTGDPSNFRLDDCATQRNLSAEGQQQAIRIGEVLREQDVVVSQVLSSQWCRCLETARLMNVGPVEPFPALNSFFQDRSTATAQTEQLRQFILQNYDAAGVTVLVTHQVNITAIANIVPQSGAAVVMQAVTPNELRLIGQLNPR